jgi:hypothetical protein
VFKQVAVVDKIDNNVVVEPSIDTQAPVIVKKRDDSMFKCEDILDAKFTYDPKKIPELLKLLPEDPN